MTSEILEIILSVCCEVFAVKIDEAKSEKTNRKLMRCRNAYSIISREKLDLSLDEIASPVNKTKGTIHNWIKNQPINDFYYKESLKKCRKKVQDIFNSCSED